MLSSSGRYVKTTSRIRLGASRATASSHSPQGRGGFCGARPPEAAAGGALGPLDSSAVDDPWAGNGGADMTEVLHSVNSRNSPNGHVSAQGRRTGVQLNPAAGSGARA